MRISDWALLGGMMWMIKKSISDSTSKQEDEELSLLDTKISGINTGPITTSQNEGERKTAVNQKRKNTPCYFLDGITAREFEEIVQKVAAKISRINSVHIRNATVFCTVTSQTGLSEWDFSVDFNNWGHITGTRWTHTENQDSPIPQHFGRMMTSEISELLSKRNICLEDYSDVVDENCTLETDQGLTYYTRESMFKKLFSRKQMVKLEHDPQDLLFEHLYPVISLLKRNGFCNINSIPVYDIGKDSGHYLYEVSQITIDGVQTHVFGDWLHDHCEIVITFHEKQRIIMPYSEKHFKKRKYTDVESELRALGFSNISVQSIEDITLGWIKRDGSVESVKIASNTLKKNTEYLFDEQIVIEYHTFK